MEKEKKEGSPYIGVKARIYQLELTLEDGWKKFCSSHTFFMVDRQKKVPNEDESGYKMPDEKGKPLRFREEADEEEPEEELKEIISYKEWQATVTECLITLRGDGAYVARVHKKGGKSLVLIPTSLSEKTKQVFAEAQEKKHDTFHLQFLAPLPENGVTFTDISNLLLIRSLYVRAAANGQPVSNDVVLDRYSIHFNGHACANLKNGKLDAGDGEHISEIKNSFVELYIKDSILHMPIKPFYQIGSWYDSMDNIRRKEKVGRGFHYTVRDLGDGNWVLANSCQKFLGEKYQTRLRKFHATMKVKSVDTKNEESHERTKIVVADHAISWFNQIYKEIASLKFKEWDCTARQDEVGSGSHSAIADRNMAAINRMRCALEECGGVNVFQTIPDVESIAKESEPVEKDGALKEREAVLKRKEAKKNAPGMAAMVTAEMEDVYRYAVYSKNVKLKEPLQPGEAVEFGTGLISAMETAVFISFKNGNVKRPEIAARKEGTAFYLQIPEGIVSVEELVVTVKISRNYDDPLLLTEKITLTTGRESKKVSIDYKSGAGIYDGSFSISDSFDDTALNLHLIVDDKTDVYDSTKALRVQHCTCAVDPKEKKKEEESVRAKCRKMLFELGIRAELINETGDFSQNIRQAVYAKYFPKNRKLKTLSYRRYFHFWKDGNMHGMEEISKEEAVAVFPDLLNQEQSGDRFALETENGQLYIERTEYVPMGKTELDEKGFLKALPEISSKSNKDPDMWGGFVGIVFYRHEDGAIYYMASGRRFTGDLGKAGVDKFPGVYRVTGDINKQTEEELHEMLSDPVVRLRGYTVIPSVYKYMREWAEVAGREYP